MRSVILFFCFYIVSANSICQTINTIAGNGIIGSPLGDGGPAAFAQTTLPFKGDFDTLGNYYFMQNSGAPRVRKISASGIITTIAGNGIASFSGDSGPATLAAIRPQGGDVDHAGNYYIADYYNNRLRKVDAATGIITTIAGDGSATSSGDSGPASLAKLVPMDVGIDDYGNIYVSDQAAQSIRKINPSGIISTVANINGVGLCFDKYGRLYAGVATRIVRIDTVTGDIDTIAGTGIATYNGDGLPALSTNLRCFDLTIDDTGNLYYADDANDRVRKMDTFGIIRTVAGTGVASFSGDSGPATAATLFNPEGVAIDPCGNLWIADDANHRIRKVSFNLPATPTITISGITTASVGTTVTVNATVAGTGSSGYSIKWYKNSTLFSTTSVPITTYIKAAGTDTITARIIPTLISCYDSTTSLKHVITVPVVSVNEIRLSGFSASIYPNPATDLLTIVATDKLNKVIIANLIGQVLISKAYDAEEVQVDISGLPVGVYVVRINDRYFEKFVKE